MIFLSKIKKNRIFHYNFLKNIKFSYFLLNNLLYINKNKIQIFFYIYSQKTRVKFSLNIENPLTIIQ